MVTQGLRMRHQRFASTDLNLQLKGHGIHQLIIMGGGRSDFWRAIAPTMSESVKIYRTGVKASLRTWPAAAPTSTV
jgi:hypothetical protein